jgi:hypothetical protein
MKCDKEPGFGECESLMLERIRYFTGRHMSARDFRDADAYHRTMRHLHNRVLHGTGIACGLDVTAHARPECGVVVHCGLAIDCCGREIVVPKALALRIDWDQWPKVSNGEQRETGYVLVLCLEYCEVLTEKVPVLYSPTACSSTAFEEGRIRESYALRWRAVKDADLKLYGWHTAKGCPPDEDDPCDKPGPCDDDDPSKCCLDPVCPPCHCVALALVRGTEEQPEIVTAGRPALAHSGDQLTHICWTNWPHGGVVKLSDFRELRVRFDRPLGDPQFKISPGPRGINERTFWAQYGQQREDLDFVMFMRPPHLMPDRRTALFEVLRPEEYVNDTIHVTLRCDFILDCHDNPVDGDHLRGRLPTGNGVPGGTFESWFRVVDDYEYERLTHAGTASNSTGAKS